MARKIDPDRRDAVPYRLTVNAKLRPVDGYVIADLGSPLLSQIMHKRDTVRLHIGTDFSTANSKAFLLDSFHIESITEYLRSQARVQRKLNSVLKEDRNIWDVEKRFEHGDIWGQVELMYLEVDLPHIQTEESMANLKKFIPNIPIEVVKEHSDKRDTKSTFTVVLKVPWDDQHWRMVTFRDGRFDGLSAE
jgi:hypothetical protein